MRKRFAGVLLVAAMAMAGCAASGPAPGASTGGSLAAESFVMTDAFGREVEIPAEVKTVVALGGAARIISYAGGADMLVGVTEMDKGNIAAAPYTVVNAEHFASLATVSTGGANDTPYMEEIIALSPDLIIAKPDGLEMIEDVSAKTGIPVLGINPEEMFDGSFTTALEMVGKALGKEERSAEVIEYVNECEKDLQDRTKEIPDADRPSVYTGAVSFRGAHGFEGTYAQYPPFTAIGAKNVADETGQSGAFIVDLEKVTVWDPDFIFLNPTNMHLVDEDYGKNPAFYDSLRAVREGNVYSQPSFNYNWTNMEISIADAYYAGKIIYPKQFADIDPVQKADEIFVALLGAPFYDNLVADGSGFDRIVIGA